MAGKRIAESDRITLDLVTLNSRQREVVKRVEGPLLVAAGAGTGKTRVLTYRIANLIANHSVPPSAILAITFTNKAAEEMRSRVATLVGEDVETMWVKTFHAACSQMLQEGLGTLTGQPITIFDEHQSTHLVQEICQQMNLEPTRYPAHFIQETISRAKNDMVSAPDQFMAWLDKQTGATSISSSYSQTLAKIYDKYSQYLDTTVFDFDDLIQQTIHRLQTNQNTLTEHQNQFRYIMVDEFQDSNYSQYLLVKLLAANHRNLMVVGDRDQSIYAFRGAEIGNFAHFLEDFPEAHIISLNHNYRSSRTILKAGYALISQNPDFYQTVHNRLKTDGVVERKLITEKSAGQPIGIYEATDTYDEAGFVLSQLIRFREMGVPWSEMVVLYRNHIRGREVRHILTQQNVPNQVVDRIQPTNRTAYALLLTYLQKTVNPTGTHPWPGRLPSDCRPPAEMGPLISEAMEQGGLTQAISTAIINSGIVRYLETQNDYGGMATLSEIQAKAQSFLEHRGTAVTQTRPWDQLSPLEQLEAFVQHLILVNQAPDFYNPDLEAVTLMTVHSVKGLEFRVVIMIGMEEGSFPDWRSSSTVAEIEEERRLAYVGINRAKEHLLWSYTLWHGTRITEPSRFITELPPECVRKHPSQSGQQLELRPAPLTVEQLRKGDRVLHPVFGEGVVESIKLNGEVGVQVRFSYGQLCYLTYPWTELYPINR